MSAARDPLAYTDVHANRVERDAYWTEPACTAALLRTLAGVSAAAGVKGVPPLPRRIWEPCAGANWIAAELECADYDVAATDIADYAGSVGYRPLFGRRVERRDFLADPGWEPHQIGGGDGTEYAIVTNPPFDDDQAEACLRVALGKPNAAVVWFLLKADFDTSNSKRPDVFTRPDFAMKIVLRWRPLWSTPAGPIVSARTGKAGGARMHYAWFGWFRRARQPWPGARILYADRGADARPKSSELTETRAGPASPQGNYWWNRED